jgi:hypothetical protein
VIFTSVAMPNTSDLHAYWESTSDFSSLKLWVSKLCIYYYWFMCIIGVDMLYKDREMVNAIRALR